MLKLDGCVLHITVSPAGLFEMEPTNAYCRPQPLPSQELVSEREAISA